MTKQRKAGSDLPQSLKNITVGQLTKQENQDGKPLTEQQKVDLSNYLTKATNPLVNQLNILYPDIKKFIAYNNQCEVNAENIFNLYNSDISMLAIDERLKEYQNNLPMDMFTLIALVNLIKEKELSGFAIERDEILSNFKKENGAKGGQAKSQIYQPLRDLAKALVSAKRFQSRRNAAITIKPAILAKAKELNIPLSTDQAEDTIKGWLKSMDLPAKHTTSSK